MYSKKHVTGLPSVDKTVDDIYHILNKIEANTVQSVTISYNLTSGYHPYYNGTTLVDGPIQTEGTNATADGDFYVAGSFGIETCADAGADTDKFLVLDGSNNVDYRTGAEVLSDLSGDASEEFSWNSQNLTNVASLTAENAVLTSIANAGADTDKFLVLDGSNNVDYRTGAEVLSDIGAASASHGVTTNYIPYAASPTAWGSSSIYHSASNVGIGTTSPLGKLDICYGHSAICLGAAYATTTRPDTTDKHAIIKSVQYDNSEEGACVLWTNCASSANYLRIGGGFSPLNAFTTIRFYTAENTITTSGTERMIIGPDGTVTINTVIDAGADTDKFLVLDGSNNVDYRTGAEVLSDIGAASASHGVTTNYIPKASSSTEFADSKIYDDGNNVGISTTAPLGKLDVSYGGLTIIGGADSNAITRTNNNAKYCRIGAVHYTNAEEPASVAVLISNDAYTYLRIGGGSTQMNAATRVSVYTADDITTTTGTEIFRVEYASSIFYNSVMLSSCVNADTDTNKFLVLDSSDNVDYRTGAEVLSDLSGDASATFDWNTQDLTGIGDLTVTGLSYLQGGVIADTNDGSTPFYVTRTGAITQGMCVYATDRDLYIDYVEDSSEPSPGTIHIRNILDGGASYDSIQVNSDGTVDISYRLDAEAGINVGNLTTGYVPYDNGTTLVNSPIYTNGTNVGISITSPLARFDIAYSGLSMFVGADDGGVSTRTNSTNKEFKIGAVQYSTSEEGYALVGGWSASTSNVVFFGGGISDLNAATEMLFYTAGSNTTLTGDERMAIDSAGDVTIHEDLSVERFFNYPSVDNITLTSMVTEISKTAYDVPCLNVTPDSTNYYIYFGDYILGDIIIVHNTSATQQIVVYIDGVGTGNACVIPVSSTMIFRCRQNGGYVGAISAASPTGPNL